MASKLSLFLAELKRRKVVRVAVVYALVGLGVIEGAQMILPTLQLEAAYDYIVILVLFGFPLALVLAWALEVTPQGIQKTADLTPEQLASHTPAKWRASSWVLAGVGLVAVLGAGYFVFFRGDAEPSLPADYVAVFPFENLTGDEELGDLGLYAAYSITDGLHRASEIQAVATNTVTEALAASGGASTTLETALDLQVGTVVTGVYTLQGTSLEVRAEISRVPSGDLVESIETSGDADNPRELIDALTDRVMGAIAFSLDQTIEFDPARSPTYDAFQAYKRGNEIFQTGDWMAALPHFQEAFQLDTTFLAAKAGIGVVYLNTGQMAQFDSLVTWVSERRSQISPANRFGLEYGVAVLAGDWEERLRIVRSQFEMDPTTMAYNLGHDAVHAGRPREALEAFEQYDPNTPAHRRWAPYWTVLAEAYRMAGLYREELEVARQGRERFPDNLRIRLLEIQGLVALNRLDEIGPLLDEVEEMEPDDFGWSPGSILRAAAGALARFGHDERSEALAQRSLNWYLTRDPEYYRRGRAQVLILLGRASEALTLLEPLVAESPEDLLRRGLYGIALAGTGDQEGAEAEAKWLEELDRPYLAGDNTFFRGAIAAHLNPNEEAVRLLRQALQEGLSFMQFSRDSYFLRPLWGYEPFERLMEPKG